MIGDGQGSVLGRASGPRDLSPSLTRTLLVGAVLAEETMEWPLSLEIKFLALESGPMFMVGFTYLDGPLSMSFCRLVP